MQEDHCADPPHLYSSSKIQKQNLQEFENHPSQSKATIKHPDRPSIKKTIFTNNNNNEEIDERRDLTKLNNQLKYSGFQTLDHICPCRIQQFDQIKKVVGQLLESRNSQKDKARDQSKNAYRMEYQLRRLQNKIESLTIQITNMQRQKEEINENNKQMLKQFKFKQQKQKKEIDLLLKQKKISENRELTIKNQFKKKDEKIMTLQNKLKKFLQKNDKNEYRNSFQIYEECHKKGVVQPVNKQFIDHILLKSIQNGQKSLDNDNRILKDCLRQILSKLLKMANTNRQDLQLQHEISRSLNLLQLPPGFSEEVMKLVENLFKIIEEKKSNFKDNSFQSQEHRDSSTLVTAIQKMKSFYSDWQHLEQQRSNMVKQTFNIFNQKVKINQPVLQRITNMMNDPNSIQTKSYSNSQREIEEIESLLCQNGESFRKGTEFIKQKFEFIKRESSMMQILKKNMDELLVSNEDLVSINME